MAGTTIVFGVLLIALGVGGYFATGRQSATALIPAVVGVVFILLGLMARNARLRMHAMHVSALLSLVGFIAMIRSGLVPLVRWLLSGVTPDRPPAVISRSIMAALMLIYLVMCIKSFVDIRLRRRLPPSDPSAPVSPPTSRG